MVSNICVIASSNHNKPIAVIVPAEPALKKLAAQHNIEGQTMEELVNSDKMHSVVLKELQSAGKSSGLAAMELVEGVVLAEEEWTPHNVSFREET
jgi:long-chain acyl-CoA synthetase